MLILNVVRFFFRHSYNKSCILYMCVYKICIYIYKREEEFMGMYFLPLSLDTPFRLFCMVLCTNENFLTQAIVRFFPQRFPNLFCSFHWAAVRLSSNLSCTASPICLPARAPLLIFLRDEPVKVIPHSAFISRNMRIRRRISS